MKSKPLATGTSVMGTDIFQEIQKAQQAAEAEGRRVAAMTPDQRKKWEAEQRAKLAEREAILQQLRGPGFVELGGVGMEAFFRK